MADSELIVRLRGENSDLKQKLKEVTDASGKSAGSMASSFKSALGTIAGAIGVAFSVKAVVDFAKQSVLAFAETERAAVSLKNVISNLGGSEAQGTGMVAMADSLERMSGFDDADIMSALQGLSIQTGSGAKAAEALGVAMDIVAARGGTLAEAGNKVYLVMTGMTRTMKEFGMTTRDGATDMDYLRELGAKMADSLSSNLGTTDANIRMTTNAIDNLKESFGKQLANPFAQVSAGVVAFSQTLVAMIGVSSTSVSALNEVALVGAYIGKFFYDAAMTTKLFAMALGQLSPQNWFDKSNWTAFGDLFNTWTDAGVAAADTINNIKLGTPQSNIAKQIDDLKALLNGIGTSTPTVVGASVGTAAGQAMAKAFQASWSPISLMGGNLPELTKYIGNLRQASTIKQKVTVDVEMTINGGSVVVKNSSPVAKAIAKAIVPAVQAVITHGQGWTPGSGGGDSLVRHE